MSQVSKAYRTRHAEISVLSQVDMLVPREGFTVLTGPSGSGKTTLLNLLGCLDQADSGTIMICNEDVGALTERKLTEFRGKHLGFIFQHYNLIPVLTARENVEYPLTSSRISYRERRKRAQALLDAIGLTAVADHVPARLSGGQRQRVAIARALIHRPSLVIADEPTANLDAQTSESTLAIMREMQRDNQTSFLFSTHDPFVVAQADEVLRMSDRHVECVNRKAIEQ
ncbi:ABC transporter ATP-binding protein [Burkholderia pyrrocinia]|nr:ABC transporter ATP-binding protein [Burkholderia pyrrocinia]